MQRLLIFVGLLLLGQLATLHAADPEPSEDNRTETDEAEFRQGGIAQQLSGLSGYPGAVGGLGAGGFQYAAASNAVGNGGSGYVNMLRNLYRPPSIGLTDKVKHWVKSFMNRRQYVKPYYAPSAGGLQYSSDEFGGGKPMFLAPNGYKAISVPLRQLQKYYKPYYGEGANAFQPGSAGSSSLLSYSPNGGAGLFAGDTSGLFGDANTAALFASGGNGGSGGNAGSLFSSGSSSGSGLFAGQNGGLYSQGGASSGGLYSQGNAGSGGLYSQGGASSGGLYGEGGAGSALFGAQGLYGGSSGGNGGGYQGSSNSGSYSPDQGSSGGSLYGAESGNSPYYGGSGSRAANNLLSSLGGSNSGSGGSYGGDLYASGASPAASVFNPQDQGGRGGYGQRKQSSTGSALYMSSSDRGHSSPESPSDKESGFGVESSVRGGSPAESSRSYSVSFQPPAKSFGSNSGFQPVSFGSLSDGFQGKSS